MSQKLDLSKEGMDALDRIEAELSRAQVEALDLKELCKIYRAIKPLLEILVEALKRIPGIGETIAKILEFFMRVADSACPV